MHHYIFTYLPIYILFKWDQDHFTDCSILFELWKKNGTFYDHSWHSKKIVLFQFFKKSRACLGGTVSHEHNMKTSFERTAVISEWSVLNFGKKLGKDLEWNLPIRLAQYWSGSVTRRQNSCWFCWCFSHSCKDGRDFLVLAPKWNQRKELSGRDQATKGDLISLLLLTRRILSFRSGVHFSHTFLFYG